MSQYEVCCYGMRLRDAKWGVAEFHLEFPTPDGVQDKYFCSIECLADFKRKLRDEEGVEVIEPYLEPDTNRFESYEERALTEEQRLELFHSDPGIALSDPSYGNRK